MNRSIYISGPMKGDPDCGSVDDLLREVKRELTRVAREEYRARRNRPEVKMMEVAQ
jgi:hypothetical protein